MTIHISAVRIFALAVMAAGVSILAVLFRHGELSVAVSPAFWVFVALIALAEFRPAIATRVTPAYWTPSTPFIFAMLLYKGAAIAALVSAVASVLSDVGIRRGWDRVVFNAGQYVLGLGAAGGVLSLMGYEFGSLVRAPFEPQMLLTLVPAVAVFMGINHVLVRSAIALAQHPPEFPDLRAGVGLQVANGALTVATAPVVAVLAGENLLLVVLLVIPVVALHRSARLAVEKEQQARHDGLTGLPNRSLFREELTWLLSEQTGDAGPAVVLIDLDRFKEVNEALGHKFGDELLRMVARRLREVLPADALLARFGGDEFGVLLPNVSGPDEAIEAAAGLTGVLRKPVVIDEFPLDVSASMGVATFPEHGRDGETLIRRAEIAMYVAKDKHGGMEVYRPESDQSSRRRLTLIHDLRKAVDQRALTVVYQPKADLSTGEIVGMEALVRWMHPEYGAVSPEEFIPLAERTGLIAPITEQVLEIAMTDCVLWHRARFALSVAVNLSPQAIYERGLQRHSQNLVAKWALDPSWLEFEITESTIMADPDQAVEVLNSAADQGTKLSIDDFGTGYSSLALLKQLPVHQLKIDRSFIKDLEHDASDEAIVQTTIQLARSLGMTVCAEGVETVAAWERLKALGCDLAQGYLLSKPLPAPDVMAWLLACVPGPERWSPTAAMSGERSDEAHVVTFTPRRQST